ncbi:acyltransferase [Lutibacter sp.]|uniref:acyltransferase family protein n=1 Tax=Lutibacter sp. TaxID=1925666 RepID=UPI001A1F23A9|nr:acyltransferase [Lutibacter sp.]MBI9042570.1 acyltransferase [Lutibacter sp.]
MILPLSKRIFGLDVIRTIAISLVVISHASILIFPKSEHIVLTVIKTFGSIGVDLFFVLSGFLIGGILLKLIEENKVKYNYLFNFWIRRWFRTLPNYYLILLLNIVILLLFHESLPKNLSSYFLFLQNFSSPHPDFFTESWSLSVEEYAYLILPFALYFCLSFLKNMNKTKLFFYVTLILMLVFFSLKLIYFKNVTINSYAEWSASFRKVVIYRMDTIYIGFLLIYFMKNYLKFFKKYKSTIALAGVLLFLSLHIIIYIFNLTPKSHLLFYVFIYLQLVHLSLAMLFPYLYHLNYRGLFLKPIEFISVHSYSIYLINYSIVLLNIQKLFHIESFSHYQKTGIVFLFLIITLFFSIILYKFFELPILRYRDRNFKR